MNGIPTLEKNVAEGVCMKYTVDAWVFGMATQYEVEAKSMAEAKRKARQGMNKAFHGGKITGVRPTGGKRG